MKKLIEQVQAGEKGAAEVLLDHLLEQGIERETALHFITTMAFGGLAKSGVGSFGFHTVQPWTYFDTIRGYGGSAGSRYDFFRDLPGGTQFPNGERKTEAHCNIFQPRRIPSDYRFRCLRVSIEGLQLPEDAELRLRVNRFDVLNTSVNALLARGFWGMPSYIDISDRDDLNASVVLAEHIGTPFTLRLSLHGWRAQPLGV